MAENINGDDVNIDNGDLDLAAIYTDEDYTGDTVFQNQDEIQAILKERETRIGELLDHMDEVGGVNRTIAMEMENLEPGIITKYRSLNSYTDDYSRTNYRETRVSLEALHIIAVAAIAVGVGVLLAAFIGWLLKTFFDEESSGGGGDKDKKGKQMDERIRSIGEAQAEGEAAMKEFFAAAAQSQGDLKKAMLDSLSDEDKKDLQAHANSYDKWMEAKFRKRLSKTYCVFVSEIADGKGAEHNKILSECIKVMPIFLKELQEKMHSLLEMTKEGNTDEVKPDTFFVNIQFAGKKSYQEIKSLLDQKMEYYLKITAVPPDEQWYASIKIQTGTAIATKDWFGHIFDQIDKAHLTNWENLKKDMDRYTDAIKKANIPKERQAALTQAWRNLKMGFDGAFITYRIFQQCQRATKNYANALKAAVEDQDKQVDKLCKHIETQGTDDQKEKMKSIRVHLSKVMPTFAGWGWLGKAAKDAAKPAAPTPPAAT